MFIIAESFVIVLVNVLKCYHVSENYPIY